MTEKINSFCSQSTEELYADSAWWCNLYTLNEYGEKDWHMLEFASYDCVMRFRRMIQNIHYSETFENDTIYVGAYGPILETEEK